MAVLPSGSRMAKPSPNAAASGSGASGAENFARSPRLDPGIPPVPDSGLIGAPPPKPEPIVGIAGLPRQSGDVAAGEGCAVGVANVEA